MSSKTFVSTAEIIGFASKSLYDFIRLCFLQVFEETLVFLKGGLSISSFPENDFSAFSDKKDIVPCSKIQFFSDGKWNGHLALLCEGRHRKILLSITVSITQLDEFVKFIKPVRNEEK
jgi:hypothetical protein